MKNAEGFKFMSYDRPSHAIQRQDKPWAGLGAGETEGPKDRTKSNQHLHPKYRPKQPFQQLAAGQSGKQARDKAKSNVDI